MDLLGGPGNFIGLHVRFVTVASSLSFESLILILFFLSDVVTVGSSRLYRKTFTASFHRSIEPLNRANYRPHRRQIMVNITAFSNV